MSPTLFAGLVAGAILVAVFGVALIAMLVVRERGESRLRSRLAPEIDVATGFEDRHPRPMVASMVRGGKAIEGLVDAEGESGRLLMRAGWRGVDQRVLWYSFQGVLPILLGVLLLGFWLFAEVNSKFLVTVLLGVAAAVLSFLLPRWILRGVAAARQRRIKAEVPLLIHLLTLLFEAGLSTRQALASLVREGGGVLPELGRELDLMLRQIEAGAETSEALKNVAEVLDVDDLHTVFGVLRQVDRYGGEIREPLLEALDVIEERRSLDLREKVNLMSGRMTVVMVLFFFPALMVFVAGPAFLALIRALGDVNA
ncbi:type II secretion system F family protein [Sinimarinibacterium flocculans]|uniref:type II secretion system F family protein n=1 Tax=Sinimarinibacterium flocculans TaxID=985250 RepID=UPI0024936BCB|nr:type II secretion system F family protein [Sinimarinibacterium flocculans]